MDLKMKKLSLYPEMNGLNNSTFVNQYSDIKTANLHSLIPFLNFIFHFNYDD